MSRFFTFLLSITMSLAALAQVNTRELIRYENRIRGFWVHTPPGYDASQRLPLVINMHGFTMTGNQQMQYTRMNDHADAENYIAVYPDGINGRWATGAFFGIDHPYDDVGFLNAIVDLMTAKYNIDPTRTYSTGYSAGGFMSHSLACESSSRFAAIAPVAASINFPIFNTCNPPRKIPVSFFNGLADNVVSVTGFPDQFPPLDDIIRFWSNYDLCDPIIVEDTLPNTNITDNSRVTLTIYPPCEGSSEVRFYKILNGGHTWPGAAPGVFGNTNQDISANVEMWNFFQRFSIPEDLRVARPSAFTVTEVDEANFIINFAAVPGTAAYEVLVWDTAARTISRFQGVPPSISITVSDSSSLVALGVIAPSGYRDWTTFRGLRNGVFTGTANYLTGNGEPLLYPNPAGKYVYLNLENFSGKVSLFDLNGKKVFWENWQNRNGVTAVYTGFLDTGAYFLVLEGSRGVQTFKLLKQ